MNVRASVVAAARARTARGSPWKTSACVFGITLAAAALAGCAGERLETDSPTGVNLAGTWRLDAQASQNPQAMIDQIERDAQKRMRRRGPPMDPLDDPDDPIDDAPERTRFPGRGAGGGQGGSGRRAGAPPGAGQSQSTDSPRRRFTRRPSYEVALGPQLHAEGLTIEQSATRLMFARGDWRRTFTPGGQSVVSVAEGVADQRSGWSGRDYVIEVKPQVGPRVIERYGLSGDNRQLVEKFTLTEEGLPKLEFTRVYVRGIPAPRALPTSN